ncbi:MAG: AAA family ATPase [Firmicutes bacterium]|nr:AAA family ATPase [Bacillota bacterium]
MSDQPEDLHLRVAEALPGDVHKGIVRVSQAVFDRLGLNPGDIVAITGTRTTYAKLLPSVFGTCADTQVLADGVVRENAGTLLGGEVVVNPAQVGEAASLSLTPLDPDTQIADEADLNFLRKYLIGLPVTRGDKIVVSLFGASDAVLRVTGTAPAGAVRITNQTLIRVLQPDVFEEDLPKVSYEDIGGLAEQVRLVREIVELPLKRPELFIRLGIRPPKGILLYGPPGTGKTLIARAVASESSVHFIHVNGPEIMHKYYGESEAKLRQVFDEAKRKAPSILFLDELDALAPKRSEVIGDVEKRLVGQLLALMDGLVSRGQVIVIGATNMPNLLDPALRRPGRFDREVLIPVPDKAGRREIFVIQTRGMALDDDVDLDALAAITHGYVGADIASICREAGMNALRRILPHQPDEVREITVTMADFLAAAKEIQPTATREFYTERAEIGFRDVGGLSAIKEQLAQAVTLPLKYPEEYRRFGFGPVKGVLLYGPSGTGKSMLAKALATETGVSFISVLGPSLFSKWFGESERALKELFVRAKQASPCILCIDEIDAIAGARGGQGSVAERLVSQLLMELDGLDDFLNPVIVIGTTNRFDLLDPAFLRPGRFDLQIEFPLPDEAERAEIFAVHLRNKPIAPDVVIAELAAKTAGLTGAAIYGICRRAGALALARYFRQREEGQQPEVRPCITRADLDQAIEEVMAKGCDNQ